MGRALTASSGQRSTGLLIVLQCTTKISLLQCAQFKKPWFRMIIKEDFQKDVSTTEYITRLGSNLSIMEVSERT